jgi:hypothetical protein
MFLILSINTSLAWSADQLPNVINHEQNEFQLCKQFTLKYGLIFKIAEIGWYAPECNGLSVLASGNKIVRFHYFKNVKADFFKQSAEEYFMLNLISEAQKQALTEPLKKFNNGYTDIQAGEYFQLLHQDDTKLSLFKNDVLLAATENNELASLYFNIWFGQQPVIEKLKNAFN